MQSSASGFHSEPGGQGVVLVLVLLEVVNSAVVFGARVVTMASAVDACCGAVVWAAAVVLVVPRKFAFELAVVTDVVTSLAVVAAWMVVWVLLAVTPIEVVGFAAAVLLAEVRTTAGTVVAAVVLVVSVVVEAVFVVRVGGVVVRAAELCKAVTVELIMSAMPWVSVVIGVESVVAKAVVGELAGGGVVLSSFSAGCMFRPKTSAPNKYPATAANTITITVTAIMQPINFRRLGCLFCAMVG